MPFSSKYHSYASVMYCGMINQGSTGFGTPYKFNDERVIPVHSRDESPGDFQTSEPERHPCNTGEVRFYDSSFGRFLGVDPISGDFPHLSSYNYAEYSPASGIDLHGLQFVRADYAARLKSAEMMWGDLVSNYTNQRQSKKSKLLSRVWSKEKEN